MHKRVFTIELRTCNMERGTFWLHMTGSNSESLYLYLHIRNSVSLCIKQNHCRKKRAQYSKSSMALQALEEARNFGIRLSNRPRTGLLSAIWRNFITEDTSSAMLYEKQFSMTKHLCQPVCYLYAVQEQQDISRDKQKHIT
jgi:hypothetical protein